MRLRELGARIERVAAERVPALKPAPIRAAAPLGLQSADLLNAMMSA